MASNKKFKVPMSGADVTKDWLMETIKAATGDESIKVISLAPIAENAGLISGTFKAEVNLGGEVKKLFIKVGAPPESQYVNFVATFNIDLTEVKAYMEDLPALVEFEKNNTGKSELEQMLPIVYAGDFHITSEGQRGMFLIMEDLTVGYKMEKLADGLSYKQLAIVMTHVARMHAVSYCYCKIKGQDFPEQKAFLYDKFLDDADFKDMLAGFMKLQVEDFAKHPKAKHLVPHLEKLSKNYRSSFMKVIKKSNQFVIHGDLWSNNMMFNHDSTKCKVYDWQFFSTASPLVDFITTVYGCAKPEDMEAWMDKIIDVYYSKMESTCKEFKVDAPFTKEAMVDECKHVGFFAFYAFFTMAYDPLCTKNPNFMDRFVWATSKAFEYSPELFNV